MGRLSVGLVCAVIAGKVWAQVPGAGVPPPVPQRSPMNARPIYVYVPQLAPRPIQTGPVIQPPFAPPEPFHVSRPQQVTGRPLQPVFQQQPHVAHPVIYQPPKPSQPAHYLAWDTERKETNTPVGALTAHFAFWFTNVSSEVVSINGARGSCGCTTVDKLPAQPWQIAPGSNGPINVTMNLAGKFGSIEKAITVDGTTGYKFLIVKVNLPHQPNAQPVAGGVDADRLKNMQLALADRQVVFKGECASCHAEPAMGKMGEQLYVAACGICHDSTHRAAMVPDLKNLRHPTNEEHWRKWTRSGRVGSMMPAFARAEGGPLTDEQVESLVKFLTDSITAKALRPAPLERASATPLQQNNLR